MSLRHILYNRLPNDAVFKNTRCWVYTVCKRVWVGVLRKHTVYAHAMRADECCVQSAHRRSECGGDIRVSHPNMIKTVCFLQFPVQSRQRRDLHSAVPCPFKEDVLDVSTRAIWRYQLRPKCHLNLSRPYDGFCNLGDQNRWKMECRPSKSSKQRINPHYSSIVISQRQHVVRPAPVQTGPALLWSLHSLFRPMLALYLPVFNFV